MIDWQEVTELCEIDQYSKTSFSIDKEAMNELRLPMDKCYSVKNTLDVCVEDLKKLNTDSCNDTILILWKCKLSWRQFNCYNFDVAQVTSGETLKPSFLYLGQFQSGLEIQSL